MNMNGYGSHTFALINAKNERHWVKFHFKTQQGHKHYTNAEAAQVVAASRESYQEELFGGIEKGNFPKWKLQIQVMPETDADKHWYNPFDLTKVWPHKDYPMIDVAEIEQAAFSPSNIVPGIGFSPDKMLQARVFSYADAHRHRLGTHYEALPVNAPKVPVHNYHKDGAMRFFPSATGNPDAFYEPNSFSGPAEAPAYREPPLKIAGDADRYNHRLGNDDYRQPGDLFRLMNKQQQDRLFSNVKAAMDGVPVDIIKRQLAHFYKADPAYGLGVAAKLGLTANDIPMAKAAE